MIEPVPFNRAHLTGKEFEYLQDAISRRALVGGGHYTQICNRWLRDRLGAREALITQSGTSALEMAAILCDLHPGDEVIMPSFTFVSTANAVVLRGAIPVFVDVRADTLNIDENRIEAAITAKTKAIFVVHYAGVPCQMDIIIAIARRYGLLVVEDAAQALLSAFQGMPAGVLGDIGCFSFHATKNVVSGEGGAVVTTRADLAERAHVIWEKGTNRRAFLNGEVDKYTWVDIGSSFLPSELTAAFLAAQLEQSDEITRNRLATWQRYDAGFAGLERETNAVRRHQVPGDVAHNGHLYFLLLRDTEARDAAIAALRESGISTAFHYIPLHSSPAGKRFGRVEGDLSVTDDAAARLLRLPLWYGMGDVLDRVIDDVSQVVRRIG